ncbi:ABC-F family ATP-binding cassette domain-containing protein [Anaerotardibacter muris]|uniref:ABC-F family ATP-binding cassette domain-containing protein n=1 Tax=Anaerotardibacter muris TaxID=2941505 RepID=UPI00203D7C17|nr:ABC-F family ATP-binding cassette domain-containing protein [Anaerotardibacter muris]
MAFLLGCENVHLEYPTKTIFESLSLGIDDGDVIGVVGKNGDGKSSLLCLFEGSIEPDDGRVLRTRGVRLVALAQKDGLADDATVLKSIVGDVPEYVWASDAGIRAILDNLVGDLKPDAQVGTLSGGQRRRVDLARVLVSDADVVLLDEPTNHLDIEAIHWLAEHLKRRFAKKQGALVVVTHDRWFLDEVCNSMWEVHDGRVESFEGGYSAYVQQRVERDRQIEQAEQKRRNLARRELAWLSRGARARSTKPKFHVEAARALIAQEPPIRNSVELKRAAISRLGKKCIELTDVDFTFDGAQEPVLEGLTWLIGPGDRYGVLGENGAGKSTLLDIARGNLKPQHGKVEVGKTVKIAFLSQALSELEELGDSLVREVLNRYQSSYVVDGKVVSPAALLEQLGFEKAYLNTQVKALSGGQKRRMQLMLILLDAPNVLILDEPSNDMDIDMLVAMENMLDTWPGTLILVTHDRYMMERVTDHQFALIDGKLRHVPRGADEYLELLEASHRNRGDRKFAAGGVDASEEGADASETASSGGVAAGEGAPTKPTLSGGEQREVRKRANSLERRMQTLEGKIADAQTEQSEADPSDYVALGKIQSRITDLQSQLATLEEEWLELSDLL